jgi:4-methyl-5(b-hydroxyethyl)-thiazole monophosphate biosynthesis
MPTVLVPLAQGCEELEAVTVIDVLRRAGVEVVTAGLNAQPVRASRQTVLVPDTTLDQVEDRDFDMVVLPGGLAGADNLNADQRIHRILKRTAEGGRTTAAICAAPKVLASAGLLSGRTATSFPGALDALALSDIHNTGAAVEKDGSVITGRSAGTAMSFALTLVESLCGAEKRAEVEDGLKIER